MRTIKMLASLAALLALHAATAARAADPALIASARGYVESATVSQNVLGLMHTGASYTDYAARGVHKVNDADGNEIPGAFAVTVRISWAFNAGDADYTDVNYFFNARGRFTELSTGRTTAILSQPFLVSGLGIEVIKAGLLDNLKGKPNEKVLAPLIKKADAKSLTEIGLMVGQP